MEPLVIFCVAATLLTGNAFAFRFSRDDGIILDTNMSNLNCEVGSCVVRDGKICRCGSSGKPLCAAEHSRPQPFFCTCEPQKVLQSVTPCVCPANGLLPEAHCPQSFKHSSSNMRNVKGKYNRQAMPFGNTPCGYWQCTPPSYPTRMCVWIPCINPMRL